MVELGIITHEKLLVLHIIVINALCHYMCAQVGQQMDGVVGVEFMIQLVSHMVLTRQAVEAMEIFIYNIVKEEE